MSLSHTPFLRLRSKGLGFCPPEPSTGPWPSFLGAVSSLRREGSALTLVLVNQGDRAAQESLVLPWRLSEDTGGHLGSGRLNTFTSVVKKAPAEGPIQHRSGHLAFRSDRQN